MKSKVLFFSLVLGLSVALFQNVSAEPIEAGFGKIKLNGLMQFWYQNDNGVTPTDTFRLRRAEIKLSGEIKPEISWAVMIAPAQVREDDTKTTTVSDKKVITSVGRKSPLQDFLISIKLDKGYSVDFGQYKVPFGMEGLESSAKLDFVERSMLVSQLKWADYRDVGFTVKGNFQTDNIEIQPALGFFNGEGQNKLDANESIDFVARIVVKPKEELHLGIAHYNGKTGADKTSNIRTGVEAKYTKEPVSVYGEYITGKSSGKDKKTYYITATYKFLKSYQAALRYDYLDPDTDTKNDAKTETTFGLNYFIEKHNAKVQLNYVFRGEEGASVSNDVVRVNVQISY
jgi:hypothetical protein